MPDDVARLVVALEADISRFSKGLENAQRLADQRFGAIEQRMAQTESVFGKAFGNIGSLGLDRVLSVTAIEEFSRHILDMAADLSSASKTMAVTSEQLQTLRQLMEEGGGSAQSADQLIRKLNVSLGAAKDGAGAARDAFAKLNFSPADISGDPVQVFERIAKALLAIPDPTERARIQTELFGRAGQQLERILGEVSAGLDESTRKFDAQGKIIHNGDTEKAAQAVTALGAAWTTAEAQAAPAIISIADGIARLTTELATYIKTFGLASPAGIGALLGAGVGSLAGAPVAGALVGAGLGGQNTRTPTGVTATTGTDLQARIAQEFETGASKFALTAAQAIAKSFADHPLMQVTGTLPINPPIPVPKPDNDQTPFQSQAQIAAAKLAQEIAQRSQAAVAKSFADLIQQQARLAKATSDANAQALAGSQAYYEEVRKGIQIESDAAEAAAHERADADIASIDKTKVSEAAYSQLVTNIRQKEAIDVLTIRESLRKDTDAINQKEIADRQAASDRIIAIEQQRKQTIDSLNAEAAAAIRNKSQSDQELAAARTQGTPAQFDVAAKAIQAEADAQKAVIAEEEKQLEDSLYKRLGLTEEYEQSLDTLHQITADKIAAVDEHAAAEQIRLHEQVTNSQRDAVSLADQERQGLYDIGGAALKGFGDMKTAAASALEQVAQLIFKLYVLKPLVEGIFGPEGTAGGGLLGGLFSAIGGLFADGGKPPVGRVSVIGERGPELFVPSVPGTVVPNHLVASWLAAPHFAAGGQVVPGIPNLGGEFGPELFIPRLNSKSVRDVAQGAPVKFELSVHVDGNGDKDLMQRMQTGAQILVNKALTDYDRLLPTKVNRINDDPYRR